MNTTALKSFAPEVRRQLMEAVERKLDFVLTGDTADLRAAQAQVAKLREEAEESRSVLIERVAYTWFNRLAALRYFDARGWHPFRTRVLMPATAQETQPELLKLTRTGSLPEVLKPFTGTDINDLLDGHLPSDDPQGEVYRHLILASCRFYHDLLPFLFERLDDETELLLPDDLLTEHSVAQGFRTQITDKDCSEVEILGWLYQFYISEKKDQVMARKKAVPTEDIPAVTQLFTPHWIVRYLVENSLGRLWLNSRPGSRLKEHMPYYVDDPEGQKPADSLKVERPEEIILLDPACGSGHMLTYSFDLLYRIYEEEGYAPTDIPEKILKNNIYGLEICPRATQLSQLALVCKAREKTRTAFSSTTQPQVMCLEDVPITPEEMKAWIDTTGLNEAFEEKALQQVHQFRENTSALGSLIQPVLTREEIHNLKIKINARDTKAELGNMFLVETYRKITKVLDQADMLSQRNHIVVTNPPYMGFVAMSENIRRYIEDVFPTTKYDFYAMFIERNFELALSRGLIAMITMQSWMFHHRYREFREWIINKKHFSSMAHLGANAFDSIGGEVVSTVSFVVENGSRPLSYGLFFRLTDESGEAGKADSFISQLAEQKYFTVRSEMFEAIPGRLIGYWIGDRVFELFRDAQKLDAKIVTREGMATANNDLFLRFWHEVTYKRIGFGFSFFTDSVENLHKWFPYSKGGTARKWYGNNDLVVDWENDGHAIKNYADLKTGRIRSHNYNGEYGFREGITWSSISSGDLACRYSERGYLFDSKGAKAFSEEDLHLYLALLNSRVVMQFLCVLSPTLDYKVGDILQVPYLYPSNKEEVTNLAILLERIARTDWDNFETSWDFIDLPLLRDDLKGKTLNISCLKWETYLKTNNSRMQELETENNRIWIEAYGLKGELGPEVPEEEITLARPDRKKDVAAFLSYAVGCMMGRYSLDKEGFILADAGDTLENYLAKVGKPLDELTFTPDEDGIIPVLDGEWFEDDIVARTRDFLRVTFGEDTLEENLRFIEESLGKELRKYFLTDFYKNHYSNERAYGYKKRPIYWMFQSPKKGFMCLIYLHRYNRDTANTVLNRYLREYLHKLRSRIENLDYMLASEATPSREKTKARKESEQYKKTLRECEEWERDTLLPLAQQRSELDLDDGVKVNYPKLGKALAPIPGLTAKEGEG